MNEVSSVSNGSCTINELEHGHEHEHELDRDEHDVDLDLDRSSDDKERLTMSGENLNSGEHADVSLPNDFGSNSQNPNHLTSSEDVNDNVLGNNTKEREVEKSHELVQSSSPPNEASSPRIRENSPATATKGLGLRKWRRIRRDISKDATTSIDPIKMLKRGSANVDDVKQPSDVSLSSTNAIVQTPGDADGFGPLGSSSSYCLPVNTTFSAGVDSDNSEDRSSKSSTAASVPKYRHDALRALGHPREKHRVKNVGGRNMGSGGQRSQAGKALSVSDTSKKARGESVNIEKENSLSSMESDSRSYNSVFVRGKNCVTRDQTQSGRPTNDDDVDDDDEPLSEEQSVEEVRGGCSKDRSVSQESSSDGNNGKSKNHNYPRDCDPLVNSIRMLQSAQAALEKEIQQFGEIGKGIHSFCEDLGENTAASLGPEVCTDLTSDGWGLESNHVYKNKDVQTLERRLGEADVRLKDRESKIIELEATIKSTVSPLEDIESASHRLHKRTEEMEAELETLFKQKVEAEVEFVAMTRSNNELSALVENHMKLLKEQKTLVREIAKSSRTAEDVENKAIKLQGQLKEVGAFYEESSESEEIQTIKRRVFKFTKYFFIQLILLFLVLGSFLSQLSPKSEVVVPT